MNNELYRLHRGLFIGYVSFAVVMALLGVLMLFGKNSGDAEIGLIGIPFLPIAAIHYYAAKGARAGREWGRSLSRTIAFLMLFGFPIGTAIGIYIFRQTEKKWQEEDGNESSAASLNGAGTLHPPAKGG